MDACRHCGKPRAGGDECPFCGVIYAKAHVVAAPAIEAPPAVLFEGLKEDARIERWIRIGAIPIALLLFTVIVQVGMLRALDRVVFTMWLHESGHALTALLCGFAAFPTPWKTPIAETRSIFVGLLVAAGIVALIASGVVKKQPVRIAAGAVLLVAQLVGTLLLKSTTAKMWIYFGGDAGAMVFGMLLMTTVYARRGTSLRDGWLRWGFLVIGAGAFADTFTSWLAARGNIDRIPFGANEGSGPSDPSVLFDQYNWTLDQLIGRYVWLGVACLVALAVVYAIGLAREDS